MYVILKQEVQNLGSRDEIVKVKPGYARNYLIPQGLAIVATPSARKELEEKLRQRAHKEAKILADAKALAEKLMNTPVKVATRAAENGRIFGSVNAIMLSDALKAAGFQIDRRQITMPSEPIKTLGYYKANVRLHKEVQVDIEFEVIAEP
ncbi:MAG: 50S ribosomal protein L9 [Flavobacteriales bacterium]|nr:50S ribosomal protein L9 [Flavobacteriales bacterium]MCX7768223.1 50S ribosomal protein L9 [Flavobacteriales bacterium]MDW8410139.1 50S ribosomal protein L9 [Flavobacteriales bacterium]